jgi:hypothetical protein
VREFKRYLLVVLIVGFAYGQDRLVDINGVEIRGNLVEITDTHIIFLMEGAETPLELDREVIRGVILSDGTIAYGSIYSPELQESSIPDTVLILRKGEKSKMIPLGTRLELWNSKRRSLGQGRLAATSDNTLTVLGPHSNVVAVDDIARMTVLYSRSRGAHITRGEKFFALIVSGVFAMEMREDLGQYTRHRQKHLNENVMVFALLTAPVWWSRIPPTFRYRLGPKGWDLEVIASE